MIDLPPPNIQMVHVQEASDPILARAKKVAALFADGFQWSDIPKAVTFAIQGLGVQERKSAIQIVDKVIDITDTPYLPDFLTDPVLKSLAHGLINFTFDLFNQSHSLTPPFLWKPVSHAAPTDEDLQYFLSQVRVLFKDGFQWSDLTRLLFFSLEFLKEFPEITQSQKEDLVIHVLDDFIEATNTPYLPDALFDPIFEQLVPSFVDYILESVPSPRM